MSIEQTGGDLSYSPVDQDGDFPELQELFGTGFTLVPNHRGWESKPSSSPLESGSTTVSPLEVFSSLAPRILLAAAYFTTRKANR